MTYKTDPNSIMGQVEAVLKPLGWHVQSVQVERGVGVYRLSIEAIGAKPLAFIPTTFVPTNSGVRLPDIDPDPACECGAHKLGTKRGPGHSAWCPWSKS